MHDEPFVGDIAIECKTIVGIGESLFKADAKMIDLSGSYVMPGIVDAHSHMGLQESGTRETDHNDKYEPVTPEMRAIDAINPKDSAFAKAREVGITTCVTGPGSINLIGGTFAAIKTSGNTVEEMLIKHPVAMKAALGENPKFRYTEINKSPKSRMASASIMRKALLAAVDYERKLKKSNESGGQITDKNLGLEAMLLVIQGILPLKIHIHRSDDIMTAIRIAEEFNIRYTLDHCTEGYLITDSLLSALNKKCEGIIIGPLMTYQCKLETRNSLGIKLPKYLYDADIGFAICTDFPEMIPCSLLPQVAISVAEGLPVDVALKSITINAARIVGIDSRVGSLEVGKDADIAVFSGHPLDYRSLCIMTFIDGKLVYERI